jgi:hypothetical protein
LALRSSFRPSFALFWLFNGEVPLILGIDSRIIGLFVGFGCLIILFIYSQIKLGERATLPIRILSQRTVAATSAFSGLFGGAFFVLIFYLPLYFQSIKGVSATKSGIDVLPLILSNVVASIVAGGLITVVGYYTPFIIFGSIASLSVLDLFLPSMFIHLW